MIDDGAVGASQALGPSQAPPPIIAEQAYPESRSGGWRSTQAWDGSIGKPRTRTDVPSRSLRAPVDARGVFVSLASAVVLVATFLPWYDLKVSSGPGTALSALAGSLTILDHGYGAWRFFIPVVALLAIAGGVVDALVRAGQRGAFASFVALRVLVLAQLGLVIGAMTATAPSGTGFGSGMVHTAILRWPGWGALIAAIVALGGSLASSGRP